MKNMKIQLKSIIKSRFVYKGRKLINFNYSHSIFRNLLFVKKFSSLEREEENKDILIIEDSAVEVSYFIYIRNLKN